VSSNIEFIRTFQIRATLYRFDVLCICLKKINNLKLLYFVYFVSMFHDAFFNSIIDEYQHMHFFAFNTLLV